MRAFHYIEIAKLQSQVGIDPENQLELARNLISENGYQQYGYKNLAEAYADCGFFDRALELMPQIVDDRGEEDTDNLRSGVLFYIAERQSESGKYSGAQETVRQMNDDFLEAKISALIAKDIAQSGGNPSEYIASCLNDIQIYRLEVLGGEFDNDYESRLSRIYTIMAQAKARAGLDSQSMFDEALAMARLCPNWNKAGMFIDIAKAQEESGFDCTPTLRLAIASAYGDFGNEIAEREQLVENIGSLEFMSPYIDLEMDYGNIAGAAIEYGRYDVVQIILGKLDELDNRMHQEMPTLGKDLEQRVEILTSLAVHQAKRL